MDGKGEMPVPLTSPSLYTQAFTDWLTPLNYFGKRGAHWHGSCYARAWARRLY